MKNRWTIVAVLLITVAIIWVLVVVQLGNSELGGAADIAPEIPTGVVEDTPTQVSESPTVTPTQLDTRTAIEFYEQGVEEYWGGDKSVAIGLLTQAIALDAEFADAYAYRGASYRVDGNMEQAFVEYTKALEIDPDNATALSMFSRWYLQRGDIETAMVMANQAVELSPDDGLVYYNRARIYQDKKDYVLAQVDMDKAIALDSTQSDYYQIHGLNLRHLGRITEAIDSLSIALEIDPNNTVAMHNLVNAYALLDRDDDALQIAESSILSDPENPSAYILKGIIYHHRGDLVTADDMFEQAVSLDPTFDSNYYTILSRLRLAVEIQNLVIELDSTNANAYYNRGLVYHDLNMDDKAFDDYSNTIQYNPSYHQAYLNRGNIYRRRGDYDSAIEDYNRAIEIFPQFGFAYWNRGIAYDYAGNYDQALADLEIALSMNPYDKKIYNSLGITYHHLQEYELALEAFQSAIDLDPNYGRGYSGLGYVYELMGDAEKAEEYYQKAEDLGYSR